MKVTNGNGAGVAKSKSVRPKQIRVVRVYLLISYSEKGFGFALDV